MWKKSKKNRKKQKNKKNKEQKKQKENRKRKRNVESHKIETSAEGALTEGCRKRKAEICSVKKDVAAGDCWPADAGMEDVGSRKALCHVRKQPESRWPVKPERRVLVGMEL